jgi:hypothetical protein
VNAPRTNKQLLYALAAALSGAFWFLIPLSADSGWGLPQGVFGRIVGVCCGVATGLGISFLFARAFNSPSRVVFLLLPFATLPTAIALFSILLWVARFGLTEDFYRPPPNPHYLRDILEAYIVYGLFSLGTPILYGLALLNQWIMQVVQRRSI